MKHPKEEKREMRCEHHGGLPCFGHTPSPTEARGKEEYKIPCPKGCMNHKYHCGLCNTTVSYSPANFSSRPQDIPNPCEVCLKETPSEGEIEKELKPWRNLAKAMQDDPTPSPNTEWENGICWICDRCGIKKAQLGRVLEYGKHYPAYTAKFSDGTIKEYPATDEIKKALCVLCSKEIYDHLSFGTSQPLSKLLQTERAKERERIKKELLGEIESLQGNDAGRKFILDHLITLLTPPEGGKETKDTNQ